MSTDLELARKLAAELTSAFEVLSKRNDPHWAMIALDRSARLAGLDAATLEAAEAVELAELARETLRSGDHAIAKLAAAGFSPERLLEIGRTLLEAPPAEDIREWVAQVLLVAGAAPALPERARAVAVEAVESALALIETSPAVFTVADDLGRDRLAWERPTGLLLELATALARSEELADELAAAEETPVSAAFAQLLEESLAGREERELSFAALVRGTKEWLDKYFGWLAELAVPAPVLAMSMATRPTEHLLLERIPEGEFLLARVASGVAVEFWTEGEVPEVSLSLGETGPGLEPTKLEHGLRWILPLQEGGRPPPELRARIAGRSLIFSLPSSRES